MTSSQPPIPPLIKEFSEKFEEPLHIIEKLKSMIVYGSETSFQKTFSQSFPKVVVLSETVDAFNVVKSLVGVKVPSDFRFPIILKFIRESSTASQKMHLEFQYEHLLSGMEVCDESSLSDVILEAMKSVPKDQRSAIEVTLNVYQQRISDLTIVVLPKVHKDPKDKAKEMKLFQGYVEKYVGHTKCLYLNVLDCSSDFSDCVSRKILDGLEFDGKHTLTILTKLESASEFLISEISTTKFESTTPFGYFYVDDNATESPLLAKVEKEYVGFHAISQNIVVAMLSILFHPSSLIVEKIQSDLKNSQLEIDHRQRVFDSSSDAAPDMSFIINSASKTINRLFLSREVDEYQDDRYMHGACEIDDRFYRLRAELQDLKLDNRLPFLMLEIQLLDVTNCPNPTNFIPVSIARRLLTEQFSFVSIKLDKFIDNLIYYLENVVERVLLDFARKHYEFHLSLKKISKVLVNNVAVGFKLKVEELVELERMFVYTCNSKFKKHVDKMKEVKLEFDKEFISVKGVGNCIRVKHFKDYEKHELEWAFEVKKVMIVYWKFVVDRFVDSCALNFKSFVDKMMAVGLKEVIQKGLIETIEYHTKPLMLEPIEARNKANLERRIRYLKKAMSVIKKFQNEFQFLL